MYFYISISVYITAARVRHVLLFAQYKPVFTCHLQYRHCTIVNFIDTWAQGNKLGLEEIQWQRIRGHVGNYSTENYVPNWIQVALMNGSKDLFFLAFFLFKNKGKNYQISTRIKLLPL